MGMRIEDSLVLSLQPIVEAKLHEFTTTDGDSNHIIKPGKGLIAMMGASHWGYVNNNLFWYRPETVDSTLPTWVKPYEKPVLTYHPGVFDSGEPDTIGRIKKARYCNGMAREFVEDDRIPNNRPHGYIEFTTRIGDPLSIQKIIDKRLDTVSISAIAVDVMCSICGKQVGIEDSECKHDRGRRYNDKGERDSSGTLCYYKAGPLMGRHVAFVHSPGDAYAGVTSYSEEGVEDSYIPTGVREVASAELWIVDSDVKLLINLHDNEGNVYDLLNDTGKRTIIDTFNAGGDKMEDNEKSKDEEAEKTAGTENTTDTTTDKDKGEAKDTGSGSEKSEVVTYDSIDIVCMTEVEIEAILDQLTEDAKLTYGARKNLPDSAFCGPGRSFPAHDAAHVRNGLARLNQSNFSSAQKSRIHGCLVGRAKKYGIKVGTKTSSDGKETTIDSVTIVDILLVDASIEDILALDKVVEYLKSVGIESAIDTQDSCDTDVSDKAEENVTVEDKAEDKATEEKPTDEKTAETSADNTVIRNLTDELKLSVAQNIDLVEKIKLANANRVVDLMIKNGKTPESGRESIVKDLMTKTEDHISDMIKLEMEVINNLNDKGEAESADSKQLDSNRDNADGTNPGSTSARLLKPKNKIESLNRYINKSH